MLVSHVKHPRSERHIAAGLFAVLALATSFFSPILACILIVLILLILLARQEIHFDVEKRRYRMVSGLLPFATTEGDFLELYVVEIDKVILPSEGATQYVVILRWVGDRKIPWQFAAVGEFKDGLAEAQRWSDQLGLSLVEGPNLASLRKELNEVAIK